METTVKGESFQIFKELKSEIVLKFEMERPSWFTYYTYSKSK